MELSASEQRVLQVFRKFRVGPGQMLCLNSNDQKRFRSSLQKLLSKNVLVRETFKGAYSLTPEGFTVMRELA